VNLKFVDGVYVFSCTFENRHIPKKAGFFFDSEKKRWFTPDAGVAARLRSYADDSVKSTLTRYIIEVEPWSGPLLFKKGNELLDYQPKGIEWILSRNHSYLAAKPGTGKTIMAAVAAETLKPERLVYICPPFLVYDVQEKFERWSNFKADIFDQGVLGSPMLIVPDSKLYKAFPHIQNFLKGVSGEKRIYIDEAHRFKTASSHRTEICLKKVGPLFDRVSFLSGTPMPNRPMELYPILSNYAPETINYMNAFEFGRRYCAGHRNQFGWDFSGASNMEELARSIKEKFMLSIEGPRDKAQDEMVVIGADVPPELMELNQRLLREHSPEDLVKSNFPDTHLATYRKELGILKVEPFLPLMREFLETTDESFLIFAHHKEVIERLETGLMQHGPLTITGSTPTDRRYQIVKEFTKNPKRRILILNIQAGGVGFDLIKANRVIFLEFPWVPAEIDQAIHRADRHGQTQAVLAQYIVYKNSLDRAVLETIFQKRKVIKHL